MRTVIMVSPLGEATMAYLLCLQKGARLYLKEGFSSVCDAEKFATYDPESGEYQQRALPTFISRRVFPQCVMQRSLLLMTQNLGSKGHSFRVLSWSLWEVTCMLRAQMFD